jgi:hypothetical protein
MRLLLLILSLIVAACTQASAPAAPTGIIADYRNVEDGSTLKIEASENGEARLQYSNQPFYMIVKGGEAYVIYTFTQPPRVTRVSDLQKVMKEVPPSVQIHADVLNKAQIELAGPTTIAGYTGKAYALHLPEGIPSRPVLVVSDDPKLHSIGVPVARMLDFSIATMRLAGKTVPPNFLRIRTLIGDGTPLIFAGYKLESIEKGQVDEKTFDLPGQPMSLDELRRNARSLAKQPQ